MQMKVLNLEKPIIAMIHVDALPGTPKYKGDIKAIINKAKSEAKLYKDAGIDVLMIENMHDVPYLNRTAGPEITAIMSILLYEVKNISGLPSGIQVLYMPMLQMKDSSTRMPVKYYVTGNISGQTTFQYLLI